jgi:putative flippase GtrA
MLQTKKSKSKPWSIKQIVEYLVSGGAYFWTGYLAFFIFWSVFHWNLFVAKVGADIIGWVVNYSLQRYWVFNNADLAKHKTDVTGRYLIITAADFLIDYLIVKLLRNAGLSPYLGQFVSAAFFTIWNYFWYKYWVFPEKKVTQSARPRPRNRTRVA